VNSAFRTHHSAVSSPHSALRTHRSALVLVLLVVFLSLALAAKKCPKCGQTYSDDENFCATCFNPDSTPVKLVPVEKPKPQPEKSKPKPEPKPETVRPAQPKVTHAAPAGAVFLSTNAKGYEEYLWLKDSSVMLKIPAGTFTMGSDDGDNDEKPVHQVHLGEYYIDKYEVTNRQYKRFCDATRRSSPEDPSYFTSMTGYFRNYPDYPVVNVSWDDAAAYCTWAGKRLPTEAEWEKAARGSDSRKYPWGNDEPDAGGFYRANWGEGTDRNVWKRDGYEYTSPVGSYERGASPYGCMDMAGNVWEWCADWYDAGYYGRSPGSNPTGPSSGSSRVYRGGSWYYNAGSLRCAFRTGCVPSLRRYYLGFRCSAVR